jgi:hypothetical protein
VDYELAWQAVPARGKAGELGRVLLRFPGGRIGLICGHEATIPVKRNGVWGGGGAYPDAARFAASAPMYGVSANSISSGSSRSTSAVRPRTICW